MKTPLSASRCAYSVFFITRLEAGMESILMIEEISAFFIWKNKKSGRKENFHEEHNKNEKVSIFL
jgi:hypothetical protein